MVSKLKTYWVEVLFFLLALVIGVISHWGKGNIGSWGINSYYIDINGHQLISRKFLNNSILCFFFFWVATIFTYLFSNEIFKNRKWALLTVIIWYCTPVLPGISFFDVANTPLLLFMMIGCYVFVRFVKHPTYIMGIVLAFVNVLAICTHPIALVIPLATICFLGLNILTRNLSVKEIWKVVLSVLMIFILLTIIRYVFYYSPFMPYSDFLPFVWHYTWYDKIRWILISIPPLWIAYFMFSIVALNVVYFSNYFVFLKSKWVYSFLFILLVLFFMAPRFLPPNILLLQQRYIYTLPSIIILGVAGCFEFSIWVRKRWGEKVYFIFKYSFLTVFVLQCIWSIVATIWFHPNYYEYKNWPLFFMH